MRQNTTNNRTATADRETATPDRCDGVRLRQRADFNGGKPMENLSKCVMTTDYNGVVEWYKVRK